jgi:hypothetical protein
MWFAQERRVQGGSPPGGGTHNIMVMLHIQDLIASAHIHLGHEGGPWLASTVS